MPYATVATLPFLLSPPQPALQYPGNQGDTPRKIG